MAKGSAQGPTPEAPLQRRSRRLTFFPFPVQHVLHKPLLHSFNASALCLLHFPPPVIRRAELGPRYAVLWMTALHVVDLRSTAVIP